MLCAQEHLTEEEERAVLEMLLFLWRRRKEEECKRIIGRNLMMMENLMAVSLLLSLGRDLQRASQAASEEIAKQSYILGPYYKESKEVLTVKFNRNLTEKWQRMEYNNIVFQCSSGERGRKDRAENTLLFHGI